MNLVMSGIAQELSMFASTMPVVRCRRGILAGTQRPKEHKHSLVVLSDIPALFNPTE